MREKEEAPAADPKNIYNKRFLMMLAHDMRNPLAGIAGLSTLLLQDTEQPEKREILELINDSCMRTIKMISELLEVGTFEEEVIKKEAVNVKELLEECIELLQFKAAEKDQRIFLDVHEEIFFPACHDKVWRLVNNLLSNALKFSPPSTFITVKAEKVGSYVRISVADQGIGIPVELQDKIFNIFTEAKRKGTRGEESFGLGLHICKKIAESHGGRIWFESTVGKGTTFFTEFPLG